MFWFFALATNIASASLTCPENTYASSGAVLAFNPSGDAETFDRSIPTEVDLGPVQWNVLNNGGVTLVAKIKFSSSPTRYERVFAATDSATAGNALFQIMRRDQEEKMFFIFNDGDTNCVSPDIAITNEQWISMKFWFNSATNNMEVQLNDGDIHPTDCSAVSGFFAQDRLQNVNIFGRHGGSSPHFHGAIAGFYGWNSYLSAEAVDSVLNSIVVGGKDSAILLECVPCPTDGTFVSGCTCSSGTFGSPGAVVAFNPSSASEESFTRVALNSKNVGETSWPLQTSSGFTLITKFKFTGTGAWFENVAYFGDAAQIGNIWLRRYGSGSEELLDFRIYQGSSGIATDSKCTIQSAAGSVPQNTVLNIIARWDGSVIELDINGVKASTDCNLVMQNRVLSQTYIGSSFIDTSIGGFVDSSRFLLGDVYGMYAWPRHLSDSEAAQVLAAIEIGSPDTLPALQCCAADGSYTPECGCSDSHYKNLKPVSAEIHMNTGVNKNWDDAYAAAAAAGTRLFTCTELKEYLQQNGPINANSGSSWVACTGSSSCSGKDFMQAGPSQSDRSTGQLHQDDKGWGCLGTTRYQSTQIFMFYVPEAFECAACPTDGTVVEGCQPPCVDGTSFSYWSIRKSTCP